MSLKTLQSDSFHLGACYYPEHWPKELWKDDYRRMREMGFSIIRVAEFAWSIFEPAEGSFQFDLFDEALDLAHAAGLKVIVGTPTATPPAWLTHKYPEVLNVSHEGVVYQHGQRRHYNYNAPIYRELSARITRAMAEHYKDHPAVVGWQIDNEFNCETNVFYSAADHAAFRVWLREKYGTLDALNKAWGAVFWNQTYTDWEQVHLTRPTPSASPNPHQALDEKRFISDSVISFARAQADILREVAPKQWVTTNGLFGHLDSHRLTQECLDFFSYDSYPNFSTIYPDEGPDALLDRKWSLNLSAARSVSPQFCVMEQQAGPGGWVNKMEMPSPKPGQMRLWTYQSIAHGADMLLYFRWRTATIGTEIYWHGINDYHNRPNRRVEEAKRIGEELGRVGQAIIGNSFEAQVAIVRDYDNEWDGELDRWHGPLDKQSVSAWFKALQRNHVPADLLYMRDETSVQQLSKYKLLVYPHPTIMTARAAELLKRFVSDGGTVIFGCRTGYKNEDGHCYMDPMPGPLAELCGIEVEDFTLIGPNQQAPAILFGQAAGGSAGQQSQTAMFNDVLRVTGEQTQVLAKYASSYYEGKPALTENRFGEGSAIYCGSVFTTELAGRLLKHAGIESPAAGWLELPQDVELAVRGKVFLLNYSEAAQPISLRREAVDLLSGQTLEGKAEIAPFGVMILDVQES